VAPNSVAYRAAIVACEQAGLWKEALRLFDRMAAEGAAVPPDRVSSLYLWST
jgi:pentatricopeptide repeat protein